MPYQMAKWSGENVRVIRDLGDSLEVERIDGKPFVVQREYLEFYDCSHPFIAGKGVRSQMKDGTWRDSGGYCYDCDAKVR